jgi:hypothetical protein
MEANFDIAVVAPFPTPDRVREGWMNRINCIDRLLKPASRLYVHFGLHHTVANDGKIVQYEPGGYEICLNQTENAHQELFARIVDRARSVYVHTVHLAEHVVGWLPTHKFIVDMHGIVPEEEIMLGRPELAPRYTVVEQQVLKHARATVVVSQAMARHFRAKYPELSPRLLHLPILEEFDGPPDPERPDNDSLPVQAVYAGGAQTWQNIEAMLRLAQDCRSFARFSLFSHEHEMIRQRVAELCPDARLELAFCKKANLPLIYAPQQFGLVLRDDTAVNRVSCPTKLTEYLRFGLVPIVRCPDLGDFRDHGYWYIREEEFRDGFFPDRTTRRWMRKANFDVLAALRQAFDASAQQLRQCALS